MAHASNWIGRGAEIFIFLWRNHLSWQTRKKFAAKETDACLLFPLDSYFFSSCSRPTELLRSRSCVNTESLHLWRVAWKKRERKREREETRTHKRLRTFLSVDAKCSNKCAPLPRDNWKDCKIYRELKAHWSRSFSRASQVITFPFFSLCVFASFYLSSLGLKLGGSCERGGGVYLY